jgi:hypothetical protein
MRKLFLALTAAMLLCALSLSSHPAKSTVLVVPNGVQATSPIKTIACHMRRVCSRTTAQCAMRKVCNTPSRSMPHT